MTEQSDVYTLPKPRVARSFGLAAADYQQVNQLQQIVAERLLERLELIKLQPALVVDLGAGPGTSSSLLASYFSRANILETDISWAMLQRAREQAPRFFSRRRRVCCDAENLAISSASSDVVFSNLMLQWSNNLDAVFREVRRILKPGGLFIFSSFGPDTLVELRKSWQEVDDLVHVNVFVDMHDVGDALIRAGMEHPVMETENITVNYIDVYGLMRDLKKLGAHNLNSGRRKSLTGKTRLKQMIAAYEKRRKSGKLPASYEVVYGHAWMSPRASATRVDEQTSVFPVSLLNRGR